MGPVRFGKTIQKAEMYDTSRVGLKRGLHRNLILGGSELVSDQIKYWKCKVNWIEVQVELAALLDHSCYVRKTGLGENSRRLGFNETLATLKLEGVGLK